MGRLVLASLFAGTAPAAVRAPAFLERLPLRFEENRGQASPSTRFVARGPNYALALEPSGSALFWSDLSRRTSARIRMNLIGANRGARLEPSDPLAVRTTYLRGQDPSGWLAGVDSYGRVTYRGVYQGVDLAFYGAGGTLEYDFLVRPGADPDRIRFRLEGADGVRLEPGGSLLVSTPAGEARWEKPVVYQTIAGERREVAGRFRLVGKRTVAFALGAYDRQRTLVIDPALSFATYLGGTGNDAARAVTADSSGNMYVAGYTTSQDLPVTSGVSQSAYGGQTVNFMTGDAFVAKFSPSGTPVYITYLGGRGDDIAMGLAVDTSGNAWVTGCTNSDNFPVKNALQAKFGGSGGNVRLITGDAFVAELNPQGSQLLYGTYLGGTQDDAGTAIAVDASGMVYVTGTTLSRNNFPISANAYQADLAGSGGEPTLPDPHNFQAFIAGDAFVVKLNPAAATPAAQLIYGTYIGGRLDDAPLAIAVDANGFAYIAGYTLSPDFPVTAGASQTRYGGPDTINNVFFNLGDGFVAKLSADGSKLLAATYLGGTGDDAIAALALDASANVYVTGCTTSYHDFPLTQGVLQSKHNGPYSPASGVDELLGDAFVAKLKPDLSGLVFSTFLGGKGDDTGAAIAVDAGGNVYVAGQTNSPDFPLSADAAQKTFGGSGGQNAFEQLGDGFVVQLTPAGNAMKYGTYLGGNGDDLIAGMAIDTSGNVYVSGSTMSGNFPVTKGAFQSAFSPIKGTALGRVHGHSFAARYAGFSTGSAAAIALAALANAASFAPGAVSPGMVFAAFGSGIGPQNPAGATFGSSGQLLDTNSGGARVLFNNTLAPITYASATQVNGIVPYEVAGQSTVQVVAQYGGQSSAPITVNVNPSAPGLFSADYTGRGQGAIYNQDGTPNSSSNPAHPGDIIVLFGTGEGQTDPPGVDGLVASSTYPKPHLGYAVSIGGVSVAPTDIRYFGAVPGVVAGVFQVNAVVPASVTAGNQPVVVTVGNASSQQNLTVAIAP